MEQSNPHFNIVTPSNIRQVFKVEKIKFSQRLSQLLETTKVTSLRIKHSDLSPSELSEISDHIKKINNDRVPILLENNIQLVLQLNLDGVHLTTGQKLVKTAKSTLSKNQVVGSFCGLSKHSGLVAAEHGADYITFNADYHSARTSKDTVELFKWWAEFIEIPVMGECSDDCLISESIWDYCDFVSLKHKIWHPEISVESLFKPFDTHY